MIQIQDYVYAGPIDCLLLSVGVAFCLAVLAGSAFSLQLCMAQFGEEMRTYAWCMRMELKIIASVGATLFVSYGMLGPWYYIAVPVSVWFVLSMIADAAKCDKFNAATIMLSHLAGSMMTVGACGLFLCVGMSSIGVDAQEYVQNLSHPEPTHKIVVDGNQVGHSNAMVVDDVPESQ